MRKLFLPFFVVLGEFAFAQPAFTTIDSLDINNIVASVLVHGDMWMDPVSPATGCDFPAGSGHSLNYNGSLWMSGYDGGNNLHISAQTYRATGIDFWPGPLDTGDTLTYATSTAWAKIWKVTQTDIQSFLALPTHTVANTPESILTWPGKGNIYATGNGGVALTISNDMAPFVDLNGNGIYEPLLGEYPAIPGGQALWWVFSDNGPTHTQTNGKSLGIEVHAMSYGYKRGTLIDDVVYYQYTLINHSSNNYTNFRVANWDYVGLGWYADNFIGFDSVWRMGIGYKGMNCDGCSAGPPSYYFAHPPQTAVTMIVLPGDEVNSYVPAGSFTYYNNDFSVMGNPVVDTEFNNYMRAEIKTGAHFSNDFTGGGIPTTGYGSGPNCNYVFPGDPSDISQWSECSSHNNPGSRTFVLASNDFTFSGGQSVKLVFALLAADTARGCDTTSFNDIRIVADTAWGNYYNSILGVGTVSAYPAMQVYPNPVRDRLHIETPSDKITIFNTLGQLIEVPLKRNGNKWEADVSLLPAGMYYVRITAGNPEYSKFIKKNE